jgi:hypothetical protein
VQVHLTHSVFVGHIQGFGS